MRQWFNKLKRQEQLLVSIGGSVFVVYLLISVFWQPMVQASRVLKQQNEVELESLNKIKTLVAKYAVLEKATQKNSGGAGKNLTRLIDESVKANELVMKRFQPSSSGDVQVRFENAVFNNIVAWLHQLENNNGVYIKNLSVSPGNGSGLVNVSVRLYQG